MNSPCLGMDDDKFHVIFVIGLPGSGKGTQCSYISKEFDYVHLSAGELLRQERDRPNTTYGELIVKHTINGTIVPVEITCGLIELAMKESGKKKFLIDGFPRDQDNLDGWYRQMSDKAVIQLVVYLECSDEICFERCLSRKRPDDNEVILKKRLAQFKECRPVIEHFSRLNRIITVDGNLSAEEVFEQVKVKISSIH